MSLDFWTEGRPFDDASDGDDDAPDGDAEATFPPRHEWIITDRDTFEALIREARDLEQLILIARTFLSSRLADRIEEILEPLDLEAEDPERRERRLLAGSLRSYLQFCARAAGDDRLMPGRSMAGEIGVQLLDPELGDVAIKFLDDGEAWVALAGEHSSFSGHCRASVLLTRVDPFHLRRWI